MTRTTHLKEIRPKPPTRIRETDASILAMGESSATRARDYIWEALSLKSRATDLEHAEVYLDDLIFTVRGVQPSIQHMSRHLFRAIDDIF